MNGKHKRCPHGKCDGYLCIECGGGGICLHLRQRAYCPQCSRTNVYRVYKNSARKRGIDFDLPLAKFLDLILDSCAYCGVSPALGVDRADSSVGYTLNNSVSCCATDNLAKQSLTRIQYLNHIAKVYKFQQENKS